MVRKFEEVIRVARPRRDIMTSSSRLTKGGRSFPRTRHIDPTGYVNKNTSGIFQAPVLNLQTSHRPIALLITLPFGSLFCPLL
ncbi:hypothetical protein R1flu_019754 [Riccia fluitans]|uniref:Uncharacterized protein n=1 Tax=Riccia fluitans TaxID=41844 RepID=A0ABD1ZL59_9MARC